MEKDWFETEMIAADTFRISEPAHWEETNCWLLLGAERGVLFDSGLGVSDIGELVRNFTDKPVTAIASHIHWDHIGGHGCFDGFCVHTAEREWIESAFPISRENVLSELRKGALPEDFDGDSYELFRGIPGRLLNDGDIISLGGRSLEVIHTPGHSPGHICLWEEQRGWLFTGDIVYKGTIYADFPSTDPEALLQSLERLAQLPVRRIFPAHHSPDVDPDIIRQMAEKLRVLKKNGLLRHGGGYQDFGEWGIRL